MIRYLINRPIAVLMAFAALIITGFILITKVPVSLLPNIDVPQILVRVNYPNTSAVVLEENIVKGIRENLLNLNRLKNIESQTSNHSATIKLEFEYGTRMDLAYVEVNEKIDRITGTFPREMPRPMVMRINTSDIPVIRLQVIPKREVRLDAASALAEKILKKRLEQIDGVSLVDINGKQQSEILVTPYKEVMHTLGITESEIAKSIQNSNRELGGLTLKDGQYSYFVKLVNVLDGETAIANIPVVLPDGSIVPLQKLAAIKSDLQASTGYHLYNGKDGLVITIQKQPDSRMNELVPRVRKVVEQFGIDYPEIDFSFSQDQTFLLDAGIGNLKQDLIYGGILTVLLLFTFLGNWSSPTLMSINIPLSLIITFIFFYLFNISFNIISLSGLTLGIGMLIDNSIVVIDNITRKRRAGLNIKESAVIGSTEVTAPVISQVLTTVVVYAPLILLSGMAGSLIYDQAIGLTISLGVSLLVAFVLTPVLYRLLSKKLPENLKEDTRLYNWISRRYHQMISHILNHKMLYLSMTILVMLSGLLFARQIPLSALPAIEKKESLVTVDWNAPISASENKARTLELLTQIQAKCEVTEAEIGIKQFLLQQENATVQQADIYYSCKDERTKKEVDRKIDQLVHDQNPSAKINILDAPNAFTQLFKTSAPYFEARFKSQDDLTVAQHESALTNLFTHISGQPFSIGAGLVNEPGIAVLLDYNKMATYGIDRSVVEMALEQQFGTFTISEIKRFGEVKSIRLKSDRQTAEEKVATLIANKKGVLYPLSQVVTLMRDRQDKYITSDRSGEFKSIIFGSETRNISQLMKTIETLARKNGFIVDFKGQYFENKSQSRQLIIIFSIVLALLYLILAVQYESLVQPLLVMLTIPIGVSAGLFFLWITGGTFDVMAGIGFIVILGLIVDDPILKIETLNRLEKEYISLKLKPDEKLLAKMIHEAGDICLKPLLMVSLTTSIALVPVLFVGGIGNDLQKPMAIVIIGGLTVGTFFTTWFIPLAYWFTTKRKFLKEKNNS